MFRSGAVSGEHLYLNGSVALTIHLFVAEITAADFVVADVTDAMLDGVIAGLSAISAIVDQRLDASEVFATRSRLRGPLVLVRMC